MEVRELRDSIDLCVALYTVLAKISTTYMCMCVCVNNVFYPRMTPILRYFWAGNVRIMEDRPFLVM